MALNTWWIGEADQRYWMEITHREDVGRNLEAPKLDGGQWSYDLVSQVQPGDRVLHWRSGRGRGLVGYSDVVGHATTVPEYTWQPRGTSGRALEGPRTTEGWVAPLRRFTWFRSPTGLDRLLPLLDQLHAVNAQLKTAHGEPTYFPFYRYGGDQVRTQQAYLVKFPAELFRLIPSVAAARLDLTDVPETVPEDYQPPRKRAPSGRTTRIQDPVLRAAVERRSLDVAREHYESIGGTDYRERGKPYDIDVTVDGVHRHCEVKGSSMLIDAVELTVNEVDHARRYEHVDLIVVDGIDIVRKPDGSVVATGGTLRVWPKWEPEEAALAAQRYTYRLPSND
jgi:hypothetical protein